MTKITKLGRRTICILLVWYVFLLCSVSTQNCMIKSSQQICLKPMPRTGFLSNFTVSAWHCSVWKLYFSPEEQFNWVCKALWQEKAKLDYKGSWTLFINFGIMLDCCMCSGTQADSGIAAQRLYFSVQHCMPCRK